MLDEPTLWDAGQHLMVSASQPSWEAIVAADRLLRDNRETIKGCRKAAVKAKKAVRPRAGSNSVRGPAGLTHVPLA